MKALVKAKPEPGLWLMDIPQPEIGINDVLIQIHKTAICGTDVHIYRWDEWARKTIPVPMAVGHEFVGRIVEVGTTVVRTLEAAVANGIPQPGRGETNLFITPGYQFQCVDALLTNFHLPESTLLMLVCAFAGYDRVMQAYRHAIAENYRFYSYGDAMYIESRQAA